MGLWSDSNNWPREYDCKVAFGNPVLDFQRILSGYAGVRFVGGSLKLKVEVFLVYL